MKRTLYFILIVLIITSFISGCGKRSNPSIAEEKPWWQNAIFYEIFVRSYYDSDGDGVGDFNGITEKLDYLANLGIEAMWLMPINPSPSYHGYDVINYFTPSTPSMARWMTLRTCSMKPMRVECTSSSTW